METHFYTMIFFSFSRFSLRKFRTIPCYFCFCHVSISRIMNAKKKTRNLRGNHCECKTLFCSLESVYVVTDCCTFQFSAHFSTVIWSCLCVWSAHNKTFPRQFDCTYVNRWKCVFRTISDRHTISGRRIIGAHRGANCSLELRGAISAPKGRVFYASFSWGFETICFLSAPGR